MNFHFRSYISCNTCIIRVTINKNTKALMHCHRGTNRVPQWTFTDVSRPEARPGAQ